MFLLQLWKHFGRKKGIEIFRSQMTSAELEVGFYCFRGDLEHAETNVIYSMNSATDGFLNVAIV